MSKRHVAWMAVLLIGSSAICWFFSLRTTKHRYDVLMTQMRADLDSNMDLRISSNDRYVYENGYFKEICALGRPAVPLAIKDLQEEGAGGGEAPLFRRATSTSLAKSQRRACKEGPGFLDLFGQGARHVVGLVERVWIERRMVEESCFERA